MYEHRTREKMGLVHLLSISGREIQPIESVRLRRGSWKVFIEPSSFDQQF